MPLIIFILIGLFIYFLWVNYKQLAAFWRIHRHCSKELEKVPGPESLPLVGSAHLFNWDPTEFSYQMEGWARDFLLNPESKTGMIKVWIGPIPLVFCGTHESIRPILESTQNISKPSQYDIISDWVGTGLLTSTNDKWFRRRKMLTSAFHFNIIQNYFQVFSKEGELLAELLGKEADSGNVFDIFSYYKRCALDIICETAMGVEMRSQTGGNMEYVSAVQRISTLIWNYQKLLFLSCLKNCLEFPWLWLKPIWYLSGLGFEFNRLVKLTNDFTRKVIADRKKAIEEEEKEKEGFEEIQDENVEYSRFENMHWVDRLVPPTIGCLSGTIIDDSAPILAIEEFVLILALLQRADKKYLQKKKLAFLDLLLNMQKTNQLNDEDIREEVDTFMFEGHDTTSAGMGFVTWWLGQYPECQAKLHEELDEVFGDSDRDPTLEDLKKLVYLEKCIKESLRLMPSVPLIARRLAHDVTINGVKLIEGMTVAIVPVTTQRDPRMYERPEDFYPEHFDVESMAKRDPFSYVPFSAGSRNCIGQKFAVMEEKSVLSSVFRRYTVETIDCWPKNRPTPELILKPTLGFRVKLTRRV